MSYAESKKKLDAIRQEYGCKGELIFRTAIQNVIVHGHTDLLDPDWYKCTMDDIDATHDYAKAHGEFRWCTRDFEKAIVDCSVALCNVDPYDLLTYIQREVWLGGGEVGEPDYQRAIEIIRNCMCYMEDCYGAYKSDVGETLEKFRCVMNDEEIV